MEKIEVAPKYGCDWFKIRDPENAGEIKPYQAQLAKSRAEELDSVMKSVTKVRGDLESLKTEVFNEFTAENQDYFRKRMFDVEEKIRNIKETINNELSRLLADEVALTKDVRTMERRVEDWGKPLNSGIFKPLKQSSYKVRRKDGDPADEFQTFLSCTGGHSGGWHEQDHLLFLRERKKYKGKEKFLSAVHSLLPDFTFEEIAEHEQWYLKYETLLKSRKEAIEKWKADKANRQQQKQREREEKEEKKYVNKKTLPRGNIAERIKEWKIQQQLRKLEEEDHLRREKEKLKEEERKKKELQQRKKSAVNQYKAEKLSKLSEEFSALEEKQQEAQEMTAKKTILLKAFRLQDVKFIEKKKMIRLQVEEKSQKLRLAKPALEILLKRDPQRIFQPTFIWSQHCVEAQKKEKTTPVFDLNAIPRLAVPEWRRELK